MHEYLVALYRVSVPAIPAGAYTPVLTIPVGAYIAVPIIPGEAHILVPTIPAVVCIPFPLLHRFNCSLFQEWEDVERRRTKLVFSSLLPLQS